MKHAYTLEILWSKAGRSGTSFVYTEGENLVDATNKAIINMARREGVTSATAYDAFAHAECDKLQPCRNGIL